MANENLKKMLPPRVPYDRYGKGFNDCLDQINDLFDEIDLVEVVRCKDCVHFGCGDAIPSQWGIWEKCDFHRRMLCENDFCSYGKRR